jgi:hypothetical protein
LLPFNAAHKLNQSTSIRVSRDDQPRLLARKQIALRVESKVRLLRRLAVALDATPLKKRSDFFFKMKYGFGRVFLADASGVSRTGFVSRGARATREKNDNTSRREGVMSITRRRCKPHDRRLWQGIERGSAGALVSARRRIKLVF